MQLTSEVLKSLRKLLGRKEATDQSLVIDYTGQVASDHIRTLLESSAPCMITRFGSNELDATLRVFQRQQQQGFMKNAIQYVRGDCAAFWWDRSIRKRMEHVAGFFPSTVSELTKFGELVLGDIDLIDVLGSWRVDEKYLRHRFPNARLVSLIDLEPYRHEDPWSSVLAGKRVLVVHPFEASIQNQYRNRNLLFKNQTVLPEFELLTLKAVQSHGGNPVEFGDWFEALNHMKNQIEQIDFDVAIIGAGAYGLPLAAHVKRLGKQAVHLGGVTQLLFGIKGQRWDSGYQHIYNEHWIRPLKDEAPRRTDLVEKGAYW